MKSTSRGTSEGTQGHIGQSGKRSRSLSKYHLPTIMNDPHSKIVASDTGEVPL